MGGERKLASARNAHVVIDTGLPHAQTMQSEQLRSELRIVLGMEERRPAEWSEIEKRCLDLIGRLNAEGPWRYPEIVSHFLGDADIRKKDAPYGDRQRGQLRLWLETEAR